MIYHTKNRSNDTTEIQKERKEKPILMLIFTTVSQNVKCGH